MGGRVASRVGQPNPGKASDGPTANTLRAGWDPQRNVCFSHPDWSSRERGTGGGRMNGMDGGHRDGGVERACHAREYRSIKSLHGTLL